MCDDLSEVQQGADAAKAKGVKTEFINITGKLYLK